MWTKPKPLLKFGYPDENSPLQLAEWIASAYAVTDYATGKTMYFQLKTYGPNGQQTDYTFPTFEQMMTYADLHGIAVDTYEWEKYGLTRCYDNHDIGDKMKFSDGHEEVLVGLDD